MTGEPTAFTIAVMKDPLNGGWIAVCSAFPGCFSQGETLNETLCKLAVAIPAVISIQEAAQ